MGYHHNNSAKSGGIGHFSIRARSIRQETLIGEGEEEEEEEKKKKKKTIS